MVEVAHCMKRPRLPIRIPGRRTDGVSGRSRATLFCEDRAFGSGFFFFSRNQNIKFFINLKNLMLVNLLYFKEVVF